MKKLVSIVLIISLFMLSLNAVSAISTSMNDSYLSGETIISEVSGNILQPIATSNVEFRRGHILVPLDYGIGKLGERHFLWANAPLTAGNYTMIIRDVTTTVSGQIKEIDYEKNFSVEENLTDYSIKPGIISTETDFEIKIQLNLDNNLEISTGLIEGNNSLLLKPGENALKVSISEINKTGLYNLSVGKYTVPAYIRINKSSGNAGGITGVNLTNLTIISEENLSTEDKEAIDKERAKYYCYEFPGKTCKADETCSGQIITSLDGACCVNGDCAATSGGGGSLAWIGWLLAAIVVIVIIYIWMRYRKVKAEKNPLEKKILSFEKKIP